MAQAAVGFADHLGHAHLDPAAAAFEPELISSAAISIGSPHRKMPRPNGRATVEAVPAGEHAPAAGGVSDRHDRRPGQPGDVDDAGADAHRRAARPVRSDRHAVSLAVVVSASCATPPSRRGGSSRRSSRIPKYDTAPAMIRPSRCAEISMCIGARRCHASGIISSRPCQKAPMKGRPSPVSRRGASPPSTRPAIGAIDEADIAMDRPARGRPQPGAAQTGGATPGNGRSAIAAPRHAGAAGDEVALIGELHRVEPRIDAVAGEQLGMPATLDDAPAIDDADQIGALHRRQPVGDHQGRAPAHQRAARPPAPGARTRCRAPRSPRRAAGSARPSASRGRSPVRWRWPPERRTPCSPTRVS